MGCNQDRVVSLDSSKFEVENEIRKWEKDSELSQKFFLDLIYEINSKILIDGEVMEMIKFDNFFIKNFSKRYTKDFFEESYFLTEDGKIDLLKIKNLLLVLCIPKKIVTRKNMFYYDKSNYIFSYIKDIDMDNNEFIDKESHGLKTLIRELVIISVLIIPNIWFNNVKTAAKYKTDKLFTLQDKIEKISECLTTEIFNTTASDKEKLTLNNLNQLFDSFKGFLSSGYIREFALEMFQV